MKNPLGHPFVVFVGTIIILIASTFALNHLDPTILDKIKEYHELGLPGAIFSTACIFAYLAYWKRNEDDEDE
jgi:hypothetical protein